MIIDYHHFKNINLTIGRTTFKHLSFEVDKLLATLQMEKAVYTSTSLKVVAKTNVFNIVDLWFDKSSKHTIGNFWLGSLPQKILERDQ